MTATTPRRSPPCGTAARWSTAGDDNEWGGTEPLWNDITCEVLELSTFTGRDGSVERFEVGTATIVVRNLDGWADYKPAGANDNLLTVRPGRQIRVGVQVAAGPPQWLWRGVVDTTEPGYDPTEGDIVTFGCVDAKGDAGRVAMPQTLDPGRLRRGRLSTVLADPRQHRLAGLAPRLRRRRRRCWAPPSSVPRPPTSSTAPPNPPPATSTATPPARSTSAARTGWSGRTGAPVDATIGNIGAGDVCPSGWEIRFGRDDLTTRVIVGRPDETPLVMDNDEAIGLYGVETVGTHRPATGRQLRDDPHRQPCPVGPVTRNDAAHRRLYSRRRHRRRRGRRPARRRLTVHTVTVPLPAPRRRRPPRVRPHTDASSASPTPSHPSTAGRHVSPSTTPPPIDRSTTRPAGPTPTPAGPPTTSGH